MARMAALFALSEFSDFVNAFTKNFDDRYLSIKSDTEESFNGKKAVRDNKKDELAKKEKELKKIEGEVKAAIDSLAKNHENIKDIEQAIDYYDNAQN